MVSKPGMLLQPVSLWTVSLLLLYVSDVRWALGHHAALTHIPDNCLTPTGVWVNNFSFAFQLFVAINWFYFYNNTIDRPRRWPYVSATTTPMCYNSHGINRFFLETYPCIKPLHNVVVPSTYTSAFIEPINNNNIISIFTVSYSTVVIVRILNSYTRYRIRDHDNRFVWKLLTSCRWVKLILNE